MLGAACRAKALAEAIAPDEGVPAVAGESIIWLESQSNPASCGRRIHGHPHGIFAHSAAHSEQAGVHAIAAHAVDMSVAEMAVAHAQEHRAHHVRSTAATVADISERAVFEEVLPAPAGFEKLEKEDQRPLSRHGRSLVPFRMKAASRRIDRPRGGS